MKRLIRALKQLSHRQKLTLAILLLLVCLTWLALCAVLASGWL